ncbi:AraC family transcriptional regulator [Pseudonocardia sp. TRM90224]|uniref:AraC family transcriptional regulator n=1 Tax=Pseudonocardia sp. TRM90224 TaxID=2812678 RepID=UPI001E57E124|nr:AraC family transcriptional regulator [Pseudonocardia sp. TRM90224]
MDVLDDLLSGTRARGGVFNLTIVDRPWGLDIVDKAPLSLATILSGSGWVLRPGEEPVAMNERDVAVLSGADSYVVADTPQTRPTMRIHTGGRCEGLPGAPVDYSASLGMRTFGSRSDTETWLVSGTYQRIGDVGGRLFSALPATVVVPAAEVGPVMDLAVEEIRRDQLGQQTVLDRWLDLALITTLRAWFDGLQSHAPGWYRAQHDPVVGHALRLIHDDPARPWTLESLADATGVSRATLSRKFTGIVGEPPMSYLAGWRITLAADQLSDTSDTLDTIARRVGYANAFALSVAFKRLRGITPTAHRHGTDRAPASTASGAV